MSNFISFVFEVNLFFAGTLVANTFFKFPFSKNWKVYAFVVFVTIIVMLLKYSFIDIIVLNIIALFISLYTINETEKKEIYRSEKNYPEKILQILFGALYFCFSRHKKRMFLWGIGIMSMMAFISWIAQEMPNVAIAVSNGIVLTLPSAAIFYGAIFWVEKFR